VSLFSHVTGASFESWGWRIPFLLSLVLIGVGLWIRLGVLESPLFAREVESKRVERQPVLEVIKRQPKEILLSAMLRMSEQMPFYIFTVFVLEYGTDTLGFGKNFLTTSVSLAAAVSLFSVPFFGHLSDRIGRKRMYMIGAGATLLWAFPYFALLSTAAPALVFIAVVVSLIPHDMQYGPQAAFIAEAFDTRLRYSGAGIGYQLASVFAGGPAPLIAAALLPVSVWLIAAYIAVMAAITLIATSMLPDRSREDLTQEFGEPRLGPRMQPTPTRRPVGQR
jgi:MFS family permease